MYALDRVCFDARFRFSLGAMRGFAEAPHALCWLAESDGSLAGFVIAEIGRGEAYVVTLDVAPEWRRLGLAGELVGRLERAPGVHAIWLHVFAGNEAAIRFYEGRGYARIGLVPGFYGPGLDGLVYRKPVTG